MRIPYILCSVNRCSLPGGKALDVNSNQALEMQTAIFGQNNFVCGVHCHSTILLTIG